MLENLFRNAIKFTPKKGTISLSLLYEESIVRILVADTGIGIASRHHNKLFDPFTTASKGGTAEEQSYGLGLYTVKRIAEAHDGHISVISQPKKGSVFTVTLPRFQQEESI